MDLVDGLGFTTLGRWTAQSVANILRRVAESI
jgi:hypothetical protein